MSLSKFPREPLEAAIGKILLARMVYGLRITDRCTIAVDKKPSYVRHHGPGIEVYFYRSGDGTASSENPAPPSMMDHYMVTVRGVTIAGAWTTFPREIQAGLRALFDHFPPDAGRLYLYYSDSSDPRDLLDLFEMGGRGTADLLKMVLRACGEAIEGLDGYERFDERLALHTRDLLAVVKHHASAIFTELAGFDDLRLRKGFSNIVEKCEKLEEKFAEPAH